MTFTGEKFRLSLVRRWGAAQDVLSPANWTIECEKIGI